MKRPGWALLLLAVIVIQNVPAGPPSIAGQPVFSHPVDAADEGPVRRALSDFSRYEVVRGDFVQVKEVTRISRSFESRGTFLFSGSDGIVWNVSTPFPSTMILMEDRMIQRSPGGSDMVIDARDNAVFVNFATAILAVFAGDYEALAGHFRMFYVDEGDERTIGLVPLDPYVAQIVDALVVRGHTELESLVMFEPSGDSVSYQFAITERRNTLGDEERSFFLR